MLLLALVACSLFGDGQDRDPHSPSKGDDTRRGRKKRSAQVQAPKWLTKRNIAVNGKTRSVYVHIPKGRGPFPAMVSFHGGRNNTGVVMADKWQHLTNEGWIYVFPSGTLDGGPGWAINNDKRPMAPDLAFVDAILDDLTTNLPADPDRIFASGHSNGGAFTWLLACKMPERFAGFASVSKGIPKSYSNDCPLRPKREMVYIHGTKDPVFAGDEHQLSSEKTLRFLRQRARCDNEPTSSRILPEGSDGMVTTRTEYQCGDSSLTYFSVRGSGHAWPGPTATNPNACRSLDASRTLLNAFSDISRKKKR